jgi:hypothetical protein
MHKELTYSNREYLLNQINLNYRISIQTNRSEQHFTFLHEEVLLYKSPSFKALTMSSLYLIFLLQFNKIRSQITI